jgi:hypothetical protein
MELWRHSTLVSGHLYAANRRQGGAQGPLAAAAHLLPMAYREFVNPSQP